MKANQCIRIQRKIRAHLAKEIHLTRHKHDFDTENERFDHAEAFTALNMFRALNAAALMSKKIQQRNAEKMVAQQLADFMVPCQIGKVVDAYVKRCNCSKKCVIVMLISGSTSETLETETGNG